MIVTNLLRRSSLLDFGSARHKIFLSEMLNRPIFLCVAPDKGPVSNNSETGPGTADTTSTDHGNKLFGRINCRLLLLLLLLLFDFIIGDRGENMIDYIVLL